MRRFWKARWAGVWWRGLEFSSLFCWAAGCTQSPFSGEDQSLSGTLYILFRSTPFPLLLFSLHFFSLLFLPLGGGRVQIRARKGTVRWRGRKRNKTVRFLFIYFGRAGSSPLSGLPLVQRAGATRTVVLGLLTAVASGCRAQDLERAGFSTVAHGLTCSVVGGILPYQGLNLCPLHWRADPYPQGHQGGPKLYIFLCWGNFCLFSCIPLDKQVPWSHHFCFGQSFPTFPEFSWGGGFGEMPEFQVAKLLNQCQITQQELRKE